MPTTGKHIRLIRNMLGLTQEQLAEKLKVQQSTVSRWESGLSRPTPALWTAILGMTRREHAVKDARLGYLTRNCPGTATLCTLDMRVLEVSQPLERVQGLPRDEVIGRNSRTSFDEHLESAYQQAALGGLLAGELLGVQISGNVRLFDGAVRGHTSTWTVLYLSDNTPVIYWQGELLKSAGTEGGVVLEGWDDLLSTK